jgi:hypothetical protein
MVSVSNRLCPLYDLHLLQTTVQSSQIKVISDSTRSRKIHGYAKVKRVRNYDTPVVKNFRFLNSRVNWGSGKASDSNSGPNRKQERKVFHDFLSPQPLPMAFRPSIQDSEIAVSSFDAVKLQQLLRNHKIATGQPRGHFAVFVTDLAETVRTQCAGMI